MNSPVIGEQPDILTISATDSPSKPPLTHLPFSLAVATLLVGVLLFTFFATKNVNNAIEKEQIEGDGDQNQEALSRRTTANYVSKRQQIFHILMRNPQASLCTDLTVAQLMTDHVVTCEPSTPLLELQSVMSELSVRHILVVKNGELVGVVSDRDLRDIDKTAFDVMTVDPISVSPQTPIRAAITLMLDRRISSLPVIDDDKLLGIVTTTDVIMAMQCTLQVVTEILKKTQI